MGGARQRALLAVLVLHANEAVTRDRLVEDVWGDERPATAEHAVQVYVSRLRRSLGAEGGRLGRSGSGYSLSLADDELDAHRFRSLVAEGRDALGADAERAAGLLRDALELWRGPPLADLAYESFAQAAIAELEELRLAALEARLGADLTLARHHDVLPELERLVAEHPLREGLRAHLMIALYRAGRQAEALDAYARGRALLVDELGLEPGAELRGLHAAILRQESSLAVESPELLARRRLPAPPTTLVGRRAEVDAITALLRGPARVVTLTGPGGAGKTRVAIQAGHELAEAFPDGVWFVDLAPLRDPELVGATIAGTLGLAEASDASLLAHLRVLRALLVLDNFEHVDAAAPLVGELLVAAPEVKALVTSRSPLRIYGEHEYDVPPLGADEAVELFAVRTAAHGAELRDEDRHAVAAICARLDHLPLAIELAAARSGELTLAEMLERLPRPLELATEGPRDLPPRQQTLQGAIEWSERLLDAPARALFARLAVFAGGCTAEAAQRVCGASSAGLNALVRSSMVRRLRTADGDARYVMLETIREHAGERLDWAADAKEVRERHAAWFLELAETAEPELTGPNAASWLERLDAEHDNLRVALTWGTAAGNAEFRLRLAGALRFFWEVRGHYAEARRWLEAALADGQEAPPDVLGGAIHAAATFALNEGDLARAEELWRRDLELGRLHGDRYRVARALGQLGSVELARGDEETATGLYEESAELLRASGDKRALSVVLSNLGAIAARRREWERARGLDEDALALQRELELKGDVGISLHNLARLALQQDDDERAREQLRESLSLVSELGYKELVAYCLEAAAEVATRRGDWDVAARILGAAEALFATLGARMYDDERETYERTIEELRLRLGDERLAALRAAGGELGRDDAVATALESVLASPPATPSPT